MLQPELFPPATAGLTLQMVRDDRGGWRWRLTVATDTPLSRSWGLPVEGHELDKESAWMAAAEAAYEGLFGAIYGGVDG